MALESHGGFLPKRLVENIKGRLENRARIQAFGELRRRAHTQEAIEYYERKRNNPIKTEEEQELGMFAEELEPQVRHAVFELNQKGYKTISSGFAGRTDPVHQYIDGHFFLADETKQQLHTMGVEVEEKPWWKWELDVESGRANPNTPLEEQYVTTLRFAPERPDLREIEERWHQIADALPERNMLTS